MMKIPENLLSSLELAREMDVGTTSLLSTITVDDPCIMRDWLFNLTLMAFNKGYVNFAHEERVVIPVHDESLVPQLTISAVMGSMYKSPDCVYVGSSYMSGNGYLTIIVMRVARAKLEEATPNQLAHCAGPMLTKLEDIYKAYGTDVMKTKDQMVRFGLVLIHPELQYGDHSEEQRADLQQSIRSVYYPSYMPIQERWEGHPLTKLEAAIERHGLVTRDLLRQMETPDSRPVSTMVVMDAPTTLQ